LRRHADDFFNINEEELKEFFEITKKLRDVVKEIFGADMFNYAILGNVVRHVHLHFIPRYSKEVNFSGVDFKDERWEQNYSPYNKFKISEKVESEIIDKIRKKL
jgi:diadenosine tetraphosphate (Ap4A) HIT family hydrolase